MNDNAQTFGASLDCNKNVACYSQYQQEADGVCMILLSSGSEWCSGALIMSANQSFKPYILTAFHCVDYPYKDRSLSSSEIADAENWMFKFNYQMSACTGGYVTTSYTFNRATFRAAWDQTDFALMEMNQAPTANVSWLGWDKSGTNPSSGTGIHHPQGDVKKISFDYMPLSPNATGVVFKLDDFSTYTMRPNTLWNVNFTVGTTEGGSSGSPLFDQNKRIVGQLVGGQAGCPPAQMWYGRLSQSWAGGGINATRLSNWLDPTNTGAATTTTKVIRASLSGPESICNDELITYRLIPSLPSGVPANWTISGGHAFIQSGQGTSEVRVGSSSSFEQGNCTITATFAGSLPVSKTIHVGFGEVVNIQGPTRVNSGQSYTYTANPVIATADYQWAVTPSSGVYQRPNRHENIISFGSNSHYEVSCKFVNNIGCGDQLIPTTLGVDVGSSFTVSNAKGIVSITKQQVIESVLTDRSASNQLYHYEVYNQGSGALVLKGNFPQTYSTTLDLTALPTGTYVLKIYVTDVQFETFKLTL